VSAGASSEAAAAPERNGGARRALRIGGLLLAAACAFVALRRADLASVGASLASARPLPLALAVLANFGSLAAHAGRWRAVVRAPGGVSVRYRAAFSALVAGFAAGIALPARGADVVRAHLLARRAGISMASVIAASALDYVVGTVALIVLVAALLVAVPLPAWVGQGLGALTAIAAVAAFAAWLLRPRRGAAAHPGLVSRLRAGLAAVHEPRALAAALAWAFAGWAAEVAIALAALDAVGLPVSLAAASLAVLAASAAAAIQLAPGNAGSFELATALAVGGTGATPGVALAFAVVFHLVHLAPVALVGGGILVRDALARDR
jgi:glycosyltransferase AglD